MVLAAPPPGSRWLSTNHGHPPSVAVIERVSAGGAVVFQESHRARAKTGRGRRAKRQNLPLEAFWRRYRPLHPGPQGGA